LALALDTFYTNAVRFSIAVSSHVSRDVSQRWWLL